jgi:acyl-CoA thioester hydrolase
MTHFEWPVRVYYEDTDAGGVVYHSNYINFMERARTEWLRNLGFEQDALRLEEALIFAVHSMQIQFRSPARFNDQLLVKSSLEKVAGASLNFKQAIYRNEELLCEATVRIASIDATSFRPKSIPKYILTEMQSVS